MIVEVPRQGANAGPYEPIKVRLGS